MEKPKAKIVYLEKKSVLENFKAKIELAEWLTGGEAVVLGQVLDGKIVVDA